LIRSGQLDHDAVECALIHSAWNDLTKVWTLPVIHALGLKEPARFNELKRRIAGISATSLAERLSDLERRGIVERKVYPETPPRVEYTLTSKGQELQTLLLEFADWILRWEKRTPSTREVIVKEIRRPAKRVSQTGGSTTPR